MESILRELRQPEYLHTLLNPVPVYGLALGLFGLLIGLLQRNRGGQVVALAIVFVSALSAWPVYALGERGFDRVLTLTDDDGRAWLEEHERRGEQLIIAFYALALVSGAALAIPWKWPQTATPFSLFVLVAGILVVAIGSYIAHAGGKIRHREFRTGAPPGLKQSVPE